MERVIRTTCCVVGGGPAGMMAGYLFARAGIETVVVEKHADFFRDFRGDTIHPSTTELLEELGLLERFLQLSPDRLGELSGQFGAKRYRIADFSRLPTACRYIAFIPQWDFLNFLAESAAALASFTLRMSTEARELLTTDGRVTGVRAVGPDGELEIAADLVIAADGRASRMRDAAGLRPIELGAPIDVLWFRLPRAGDEGSETLFHAGAGQVVITINRGDYWQCALVIPKGDAERVKAGSLEEFRGAIAGTVPMLQSVVSELRCFDDVKVLSVKIDRLEQWSRLGLLMIGDAAHAMSPVGGVGINLAIQDAVAAANLLAAKLAAGGLGESDLDSVQRRRLWPTKVIQRMQVLAQNRVVNPIITERVVLPRPPLFFRVVSRVRILQHLVGRLIGLGVRREHVRSPERTANRK